MQVPHNSQGDNQSKDAAHSMTSSCCEEHTETDAVTSIELQRNRRILHFSDGTMEELSDSDIETELDAPDKASLKYAINEKELPLGPRLKYKAYKLGANVMTGIDYVGGGLASFLGISTPKYASEIEYYKRDLARANAANTDEVQNDTWNRRQNNNNLNMVITSDPRRN